MTISREGVANGDPFELIKLSFALNKQRLIDEFNKVKIKLNGEEDLQGLADLCKNKTDISGKLKDGDQVIMFDTMRILDSMGGYTKEEMDSVVEYLID